MGLGMLLRNGRGSMGEMVGLRLTASEITRCTRRCMDIRVESSQWWCTQVVSWVGSGKELQWLFDLLKLKCDLKRLPG